jgi:hypothetical protein
MVLEITSSGQVSCDQEDTDLRLSKGTMVSRVLELPPEKKIGYALSSQS